MRFQTFLLQNSIEINASYELYARFCDKWSLKPKSKSQYAQFIFENNY